MGKQTAIQEAIKEIAYLWGSPSDQPTYTKIFEVLESKLDTEEQQIKDAFFVGNHNMTPLTEEGYYQKTFKD